LFAVVFAGESASFFEMALNQTEQRLFDYIQKNLDERHFWEQKVRALAAAHADDFAAGAAIDAEIRAYVVERVRVVKSLSDMPAGVSMRNLAEYLVRVWAPPRPKKERNSSGDFPSGAGSGMKMEG